MRVGAWTGVAVAVGFGVGVTVGVARMAGLGATVGGAGSDGCGAGVSGVSLHANSSNRPNAATNAGGEAMLMERL